MWFIKPIKLEEFSLHKCDGTFAGNQPFLRQADETFQLKPNEPCYIGTSLDGTRSFIPISTLSTGGYTVEPNQTGEVQLNLTLPME